MVQDETTVQLRGRLIGTWRLTGAELRSTSGKSMYPYGATPRGMLMFDRDGHMTAVMMQPDRPAFASADPTTGTPDEINAAFQGFDACCGTYSVDEDHSTFTYHIEACLLPNWVGMDVSRLVRLEPPRLHLRVVRPYTFGGEEWTGVVSWERASDGERCEGAGDDR